MTGIVRTQADIPGGVPVDVGRDAARDAAVRELSDPAYQDAEPSVFVQAMNWLIDRFFALLENTIGVLPGGAAGLVLLIALIIAIVVVIRLRVGKMGRAASSSVFEGRKLTAADHRRAAEAAEEQGELDEAVRERLRAIVRGLEERGVLEERSGRTVDEFARAAGQRIPEYANALSAAARLFDDVWYGGRSATMEEYRRVAELDLALDGARR